MNSKKSNQMLAHSSDSGHDNYMVDMTFFEAEQYFEEYYEEYLAPYYNSSIDWTRLDRCRDRHNNAITIQRWWRKVIFKKKSDAAKTIQKYWRHAISNPKYKVCRNRLMHEYSGMM